MKMKKVMKFLKKEQQNIVKLVGEEEGVMVIKSKDTGDVIVFAVGGDAADEVLYRIGSEEDCDCPQCRIESEEDYDKVIEDLAEEILGRKLRLQNKSLN